VYLFLFQTETQISAAGCLMCVAQILSVLVVLKA